MTSALLHLGSRGVVLAVLVAAPVACGQAHEATLEDARGIADHTPVVVAGVRVGEVESVRVAQQAVTVRFSMDSDHELTLFADACVRPGELDGAPALVLQPGSEGLRDGVIAQCPEPSPPAVARTVPPPPILAKGPEPSESPQPAVASEDTLEDAEGPPSSDPPKRPRRRAKKRDRCSPELRLRIAKAQPVDPVPLHLPRGGYRVAITFENPNDYSVELGPVHDAVFIDAADRGHAAETAPGLGSTWFFSFRIPAHGSRRVKVVLADEGDGAPDIDAVNYVVYC